MAERDTVPLGIFIAVVCALLGFIVGGTSAHIVILERLSKVESEVNLLLAQHPGR